MPSQQKQESPKRGWVPVVIWALVGTLMGLGYPFAPQPLTAVIGAVLGALIALAILWTLSRHR